MVAMDAPDWGRLFHVYGPADDVPAQLAALAGDDREAAFEASVFVIRTLYANGTLTPATAAAMRPIAGKLDEPALDTEGDTVRDALLYFIGGIARLTTSVPRRGVRVCAALAPALADDTEATEILVRASAHPRAFDHGFSDPYAPPAYRLMLPANLECSPRHVLIRTVCERVADFGRLLLGAIAAVELRHRYRPVPEFGPYLRRAFPSSGGDSVTEHPGGDSVTEHQRVFARAIDRREELWDGTYSGVAEMFVEAGLPADRGWWHDLGHPPVPRDYRGVTAIPVGPRLSVRQRPEMYLGAPRTDPSFVTRLVDVLGRDGATVHSELPKRLTVTVVGTVEVADLDRVATSIAVGDPGFFGLSVAAALSLWVDIRVWTDGTAHRREYVDGVPTGEWTTTAEDHPGGYRVVFDLDEEWLPAASGF